MTNKFVADRNQVTGSGEQVTGNREPGTGSGERVRDNDPLFRGDSDTISDKMKRDNSQEKRNE